MSSPVPTNSCHRASTSPRSSVPLSRPACTSARASTYWTSHTRTSSLATAAWLSRWAATRSTRTARLSSAPARVVRTTSDRAPASAANRSSQLRTGSTAQAGSWPPARPVSGTGNRGASVSPAVSSISARWVATSVAASGGTRFSTTARAVLRSRASRR